MARPALARSGCTSLCYALKIKTLCPHPLHCGGQRTDVHATSVVKLPRTRSTHPLPHHCIPDKRLHLRHCYSHDATCGRTIPSAKESQRWDQATEESKQAWDTCWSWTALALAMWREAMPCASTHLQHLLFKEVLVLVVVCTLFFCSQWFAREETGGRHNCPFITVASLTCHPPDDFRHHRPLLFIIPCTYCVYYEFLSPILSPKCPHACRRLASVTWCCALRRKQNNAAVSFESVKRQLALSRRQLVGLRGQQPCKQHTQYEILGIDTNASSAIPLF